VKIWIIWHACPVPDLTEARLATREILPIERCAPLDEIWQREWDEVVAILGHGSTLASVTGFEPTQTSGERLAG